MKFSSSTTPICLQLLHPLLRNLHKLFPALRISLTPSVISLTSKTLSSKLQPPQPPKPDLLNHHFLLSPQDLFPNLHLDTNNLRLNPLSLRHHHHHFLPITTYSMTIITYFSTSATSSSISAIYIKKILNFCRVFQYGSNMVMKFVVLSPPSYCQARLTFLGVFFYNFNGAFSGTHHSSPPAGASALAGAGSPYKSEETSTPLAPRVIYFALALNICLSVTFPY